MKKSLSKFFAALIAISMIMSLLPAQFVSAAKDPADYSTYGSSVDEMKTSGYQGHVFELTEVTDKPNFDYCLSVGVYNMEPATGYESAFRYDTDVLEIQYPGLTEEDDSYPFVPGDGDYSIDDYYEVGTVTSSMVATNPTAKKYIGNSLALNNSYIFGNGGVMFFVNQNGAGMEGSYATINAAFSVNFSASAANWKNTTSGAYLAQGEGALDGQLVYKFPENELCNLYKIYFKIKDGKTKADVTDKAIQIYDTLGFGYCGGRGTVEMKKTNGESGSYSETYNEGVYFIGFDTPQANPVDVTFKGIKDSAGKAISGAAVELYTEDTARSKNVAGSGQTDSNGDVTISNVPANKTYNYAVTLSGYEAQSGTVEVKTANVEVPNVTLTKETEAEYDLKVTVKNADDSSAVSGATVSVNNAALTDTTGTDGSVTTRRTAGTYTVKASKTGFKEAPEVSAEVTKAANGGSAEIKLVPERATITLPPVKDGEGNNVSGVQIKVEKTSGNQTDGWSTVTANPGDTIELPKNSEFKITIVSNDYSAPDLYAKTDSSATGIIYTDSDFKSPLGAGDSITLAKSEDPFYNVKVTKDASDPTMYTATVMLKNINASNGTFGLRYDKDLFTLADTDGFTLDNLLRLYEPDGGSLTAALKSAVTQNDPSGDIGYHVFSWNIDENNMDAVESLDTTTEAKTVATYKFKLAEGKSEADINADSFSVMPYDKTELGDSFVREYGRNEDTSDVLDKLWRYTDEENQGESLSTYRLDESKATDRGFYQVLKLGVKGGEDPGAMADVMTKFEFDFNKSALIFEIVDKDNNVIPNAVIKIYDENGEEVKTLTTDATGIAKTDVDVSGGDVTYTYTVECDGYWEVPKPGEEAKQVTISSNQPYEPEFVYETLEEKIYHETVLKDTSNGTIENADLAGDDYAYNNKNYYFNIKPDPGYKFDDTKPVTVVIDGKDMEVEFSKADNMFVVPGDKIVGDKIPDSTPNNEGYKADDIIIKIDPSRITKSDEKYTVTALAGEHGKVEYDNSSSDPNVNVESDKKVTISNIEAPGQTNDFTFTADEGYIVERVLINGVEVDSFDDQKSFTYKFENITEDSSIAVTFYDEETKTPSKESVVTLVVGDRGSVDVTAPTPAEQNIISARRTYIFSQAGDLSFSATPDSGYEMNKVELEVNGEAQSDVNSTSGNQYTVSIGESQNVVVYVTFKAIGEEDTFNVFVKSYIHEGKGTIAPIGVLTYTKNERPVFTMKSIDNNWKLTSVMIDGEKQRYIEQTKDDEQLTEGTYQFASLTKDTSIGAVFKETSYVVNGIVDLSQGAATPLSSVNPNTGAIVTFTREDGMQVVTNTTATRKNATFTAELAQGKWTLVVSKRGYLNYTITDFVVAAGASQTNFGSNLPSSPDAKPIVLLIGNTSGKGNVVSFEDAGVIYSALRKDVSKKIYEKGDVDDDSVVKIDSDLAYIKNNYGARQIVQTYAQFVAGN